MINIINMAMVSIEGLRPMRTHGCSAVELSTASQPGAAARGLLDYAATCRFALLDWSSRWCLLPSPPRSAS